MLASYATGAIVCQFFRYANSSATYSDSIIGRASIQTSPFKHRWDLSTTEAREVQRKLATAVVSQGDPRGVRLIAGVDLAFDKASNQAIAALVMLSYPNLDIVNKYTVTRTIPFPYVPGLLSFREGPAIMDLFECLPDMPDLIMFDGQGLAHPRRLGIASHLGVLLNIPSIGVAKSRLIGQPAAELPVEKGARVDLIAPEGDIIGRLLRTRSHVSPVYVSVGHRIGLDAACRWVMNCTTGTRIPEPTKQADRLAASTKRIVTGDTMQADRNGCKKPD